MAQNGPYKRCDGTLIAALATGCTIREAAARASLGERTVKRRLADPAFKRAVDTEKAAMIARATAQLADAATEAVQTLRRLLLAESESVQLGAARSILEFGTKLREGEELAERIARLEERLCTP